MRGISLSLRLVGCAQIDINTADESEFLAANFDRQLAKAIISERPYRKLNDLLDRVPAVRELQKKLANEFDIGAVLYCALEPATVVAAAAAPAPVEVEAPLEFDV